MGTMQAVQDSTLFEAHTLRVIAGKALVDPETARRYLEGKRCRGLSVMRIRAALRELGIMDPTKAREVRGQSRSTREVAR